MRTSSLSRSACAKAFHGRPGRKGTPCCWWVLGDGAGGLGVPGGDCVTATSPQLCRPGVRAQHVQNTESLAVTRRPASPGRRDPALPGSDALSAHLTPGPPAGSGFGEPSPEPVRSQLSRGLPSRSRRRAPLLARCQIGRPAELRACATASKHECHQPAPSCPLGTITRAPLRGHAESRSRYGLCSL